MALVHTQAGTTIPDGLSCAEINVACRLAGDDGHYPETDQIQLRMIREPSGSRRYRERIDISGNHESFNGSQVSRSRTRR